MRLPKCLVQDARDDTISDETIVNELEDDRAGYHGPRILSREYQYQRDFSLQCLKRESNNPTFELLGHRRVVSIRNTPVQARCKEISDSRFDR